MQKTELFYNEQERILSKGQNLERQIDLWPWPKFWAHRSVISNQKTPGQSLVWLWRNTDFKYKRGENCYKGWPKHFDLNGLKLRLLVNSYLENTSYH